MPMDEKAIADRAQHVRTLIANQPTTSGKLSALEAVVVSLLVQEGQDPKLVLIADALGDIRKSAYEQETMVTVNRSWDVPANER